MCTCEEILKRHELCDEQECQGATEARDLARKEIGDLKRKLSFLALLDTATFLLIDATIMVGDFGRWGCG